MFDLNCFAPTMPEQETDLDTTINTILEEEPALQEEPILQETISDQESIAEAQTIQKNIEVVKRGRGRPTREMAKQIARERTQKVMEKLRKESYNAKNQLVGLKVTEENQALLKSLSELISYLDNKLGNV